MSLRGATAVLAVVPLLAGCTPTRVPDPSPDHRPTVVATEDPTAHLLVALFDVFDRRPSDPGARAKTSNGVEPLLITAHIVYNGDKPPTDDHDVPVPPAMSTYGPFPSQLPVKFYSGTAVHLSIQLTLVRVPVGYWLRCQFELDGHLVMGSQRYGEVRAISPGGTEGAVLLLCDWAAAA